MIEYSVILVKFLQCFSSAFLPNFGFFGIAFCPFYTLDEVTSFRVLQDIWLNIKNEKKKIYLAPKTLIKIVFYCITTPKVFRPAVVMASI